MSDFFGPHGLQPPRLLCPWNSPSKNTGVGSHSRGSSWSRDRPRFPALQADSLPSEPPRKPLAVSNTCYWVLRVLLVNHQMKHLLCLFSSKPSSCKFQHYLPSLAERHKASFTKYYLGVDVRGLHSKGTFYLAHATVCSFIKWVSSKQNIVGSWSIFFFFCIQSLCLLIRVFR